MSDTMNISLPVTIFFDRDGHLVPEVVNKRDLGLDLAARSFRLVVKDGDDYESIFKRWQSDPKYRDEISFQVNASFTLPPLRH